MPVARKHPFRTSSPAYAHPFAPSCLRLVPRLAFGWLLAGLSLVSLAADCARKKPPPGLAAQATSANRQSRAGRGSFGGTKGAGGRGTVKTRRALGRNGPQGHRGPRPEAAPSLAGVSHGLGWHVQNQIDPGTGQIGCPVVGISGNGSCQLGLSRKEVLFPDGGCVPRDHAARKTQRRSGREGRRATRRAKETSPRFRPLPMHLTFAPSAAAFRAGGCLASKV